MNKPALFAASLVAIPAAAFATPKASSHTIECFKAAAYEAAQYHSLHNTDAGNEGFLLGAYYSKTYPGQLVYDAESLASADPKLEKDIYTNCARKDLPKAKAWNEKWLKSHSGGENNNSPSQDELRIAHDQRCYMAAMIARSLFETQQDHVEGTNAIALTLFYLKDAGLRVLGGDTYGHVKSIAAVRASSDPPIQTMGNYLACKGDDIDAASATVQAMGLSPPPP